MRLLIAGAVSAAVVLSAPFMGRLQSLVRSSVSSRAYVIGLGVLVGVVIIGAIAIAFLRIREQRGRRLAVMATAIAIGAVYTAALSSGEPEQDAVERFHFVEYGLIAVLFYRVWRRAADPSAVVLPILCGFAVGTLDEWLQWFIPNRVGEVKDIFLNCAAIGSGLLFIIGVDPPPTFRASFDTTGNRIVNFRALFENSDREGEGLDLHVLDAVGEQPTMRQFDVAKGFFGAAGSPLVENGRVVANVGGKKGGIVAFDIALCLLAIAAAGDIPERFFVEGGSLTWFSALQLVAAASVSLAVFRGRRLASREQQRCQAGGDEPRGAHASHRRCETFTHRHGSSLGGESNKNGRARRPAREGTQYRTLNPTGRASTASCTQPPGWRSVRIV